MIVCSCNRLSDRDIRRVTRGAAQVLTAAEVYDCLGCETRCGHCAPTIKRIMQQTLAQGEAGCCLPTATETRSSAAPRRDPDMVPPADPMSPCPKWRPADHEHDYFPPLFP